MPRTTTTSWISWRAMYRRMRASDAGSRPRSARLVSPTGGSALPLRRRSGTDGLPRVLLLSRRHDEQPVDLVPRRIVVDAIADAPYAAEPPLVEVRGVLVDELLRLGVDLRAPLRV